MMSSRTDDINYDRLAAKMADAERVARYESDIAQQALEVEKARADAAEAKLAQQDDLVKRMNDARDFPANTCGASRHAAMIAEALCSGDDYPMLAEEPDHCGGSIAATVAALWECRTKLALIREGR
jgi:hypothetical protein